MKKIKRIMTVVLLLSIMIIGVGFNKEIAEAKYKYNPSTFGVNTTGYWFYGKGSKHNSDSGVVIPVAKKEKIKWTSSNKKVMSVVQSGKRGTYSTSYHFKTKKEGKSVITCTVTQNNKTYKTKKTLYSVKYSNPFVSFKVGDREYAPAYEKWSEANYNNIGLYSSSTGSQKISIEPTSQYRIYKITASTYNSTKEVKNKSEVDLTDVTHIGVYLQSTKNKKIIMYIGCTP